MKTVKILKMVSAITTSIGVGTIVSNGVKMVNAASDITNPVLKICTAVASFAISGMIADKASTYMEKEIDSVVESFKTTEEKDEDNGKS